MSEQAAQRDRRYDPTRDEAWAWQRKLLADLQDVRDALEQGARRRERMTRQAGPAA